jgi:hypothetical protein
MARKNCSWILLSTLTVGLEQMYAALEHMRRSQKTHISFDKQSFCPAERTVKPPTRPTLNDPSGPSAVWTITPSDVNVLNSCINELVTFILGIFVLFPGFWTSFLFKHAVELSVKKLSVTVHRSDSERCTLHTFLDARLLGVRSDTERCILHTFIAARLLRVFDRFSGDTSLSSLRSSMLAHLSRTISCFIFVGWFTRLMRAFVTLEL